MKVSLKENSDENCRAENINENVGKEKHDEMEKRKFFMKGGASGCVEKWSGKGCNYLKWKIDGAVMQNVNGWIIFFLKGIIIVRKNLKTIF